MTHRLKYRTFSILLSVGFLSGCDRPPDAWTPVLEETSTVFLETETDRALNGVQEALANLRTDPEEAERSLQKAETSLEYLIHFYLPLFQARERAYNAYRYFVLGEEAQVDRELRLIEETLASMAEAAGGGPNRELQSLAEMVAAARIAVRGGPEEAKAALEALARRLEQVVVKGDLIIGVG
jgi:hypothetical protein